MSCHWLVRTIGCHSCRHGFLVGVSHLSSLQFLRALNLSQCYRLTSTGIRPLSHLPRLSTVSLIGIEQNVIHDMNQLVNQPSTYRSTRFSHTSTNAHIQKAYSRMYLGELPSQVEQPL